MSISGPLIFILFIFLAFQTPYAQIGNLTTSPSTSDFPWKSDYYSINNAFLTLDELGMIQLENGGVLTDHRIVAVKCLKNVTGGDNEFWAEVTIIARMHHLNLVRLWGFCAEKGQRILVYEYISDFGLSKLRKKEDMVSYSRMRGTRGYMAPEWVKSDQITPKADVYSFGMVLLEIVTGVRNFDIQGSKMDSEEWYFPRWAFDKVYKEMNIEDILDNQIKGSYDSRLHEDIVIRMVKTAIWCLQDRPEMRPSMGKVAKMLEGTVEIIEPKKPTIFFLGDD
ncbi:hypothetical protein E3N88_42081 [Mikania micrantha]|uniref:Protein kinase domain-containing protein n=1 Tax=Mikania micrantha TaxID=192012 RepID=A0A5N6LIR9_9ASTR|nr:hypothetical protein E3N88_42081 [Mikania micrantha]